MKVAVARLPDASHADDCDLRVADHRAACDVTLPASAAIRADAGGRCGDRHDFADLRLHFVFLFACRSGDLHLVSIILTKKCARECKEPFSEMAPAEAPL